MRLRRTPRPSRPLAATLVTALAVVPSIAVLAAHPAAADPFTAGNVVVLRAGAGDSALGGTATPAFLDEYTATGTLVRSVPLPTATNGANRRVTLSGTATSEGALSLSQDGRYLTLGGYDADPGTAAIAGTTTAAVNRVVARVDGEGTVDSSTAITDAFSGANVRGATSADGSGHWAVGSNNGVRYVPNGGGASTQLATAPTNVRAVTATGGQLFISTGSAPAGVYAVGTGQPTTSGQTATLLAASPSPYGIVALDRDPAVPGADTLYVADDSGSPNGGILKFSSNGSTWTAQGSFRPAGAGARGLTGQVTPTGVTLFATTSTGAGSLVKVDDTAASAAPIAATGTTLRVGATNTAMRGVAFAPTGGTPQPPTAPSITTQPADSTVLPGGSTTLTVAASGTAPLSYQWFEGVAGDTSTPVGTGASFTSPALAASTSYWVRVTGPGGTANSRTAAVTVDNAPACTGAVATIGSVQGTGDTSPVSGQTVTVRGTVVGDYEGAGPALRGFYLQDAGDGNPATSDGVFVFTGGATAVANGDVVEVTGPVAEFQGQTQIAPTNANVRPCGAQAPVTPVDVALPRATAADLEPYEGMLVRLPQTLTVTEHFQLGRFGQVVVSSGGKLQQPTSILPAADTAAVAARQAANNLNRLIIDDATQAQNPDPIAFGRGGQPLSAANTLRGGDTVTGAVGVLTYTWAGNAASGNAYRLRPIGALGGAAAFEPVNERPTSRPDTGTGGVKVSGANLLNLFNTYTGCRFGTVGGPADCRGATNDLEYQRQLTKEVEALRFLDADVTGIMEIENDGYGPTSAIQALVDALNAVDGPGSWAFVDADAATGVVDVAGTDAIKTGLLYRPARVTPVAGATFVDQNAVFERRPVTQTFQTPAGARFTVTANHFKSKGSCPTSGPDADQGDGQSCWNARRTAQANELASWLNGTVVPAAGDPDVLIVGDLNSYAGEDPITALAAAGYTNLAKKYQGDDTYSYVFDGQWGYLDYGLSSASLTPQVTGAGEAHHNADEPSVLDYNTDFKTPGQVASLYAPDRFRTSDHDPILVGLDLGTAAVVSGTPPAGTVGAPYTHSFTLSSPAATTVSAGALPPGLALNESGALVGVPTKAGDYAFVVRAANAYGSTEFSTALRVAKGASAVSVTAAPSPVATGAPVTVTATVTGPVPPTGSVTFTEGATALGTATLVDGVASITVPGAVGPHEVTAAYSGDTDLLGASGTAAYTGLDPVVLSGTLPDGKVGVAYSATVPRTGGEPVALSVSAGSLPPGLALSPAGVLSGTPTTAGAFSFTVTASNAVSSTSRDYAVVVASATTTTVVTSSANPSIVGAAVRFTATVTGATGGTVQFTVDGRAFGGPVAVVDGKAVSDPVSTLGLGAHAVTAAYSGPAPSTGTLTQNVQVGVKVLAPGATAAAGSTVPVRFQLTDASGRPLPITSIVLLLTGRVTVSAAGAQSFGATQPLYDLSTNTFVLQWKTAKKPVGAVTLSIKVTFPGVPDKVVQVPVVLK